MSNVVVKPGQSLYDIAVQHAGSAEAVFSIAQANGLAVTATLAPGQTLTIPDVADKRVVAVFGRGYVPASDITEEEVLSGIDYWAIELEFEVQ